MTEGELKFALQVESVLNCIPEPEYRQLIVEAIVTLTIFSQLDQNKTTYIQSVVSVNKIVERAYQIFFNDRASLRRVVVMLM